MFEVFVLAEKKNSPILRGFAILMLILGIFALILSGYFIVLGFLCPFMVVFGVYFGFFNNVEFEYSYFDGEVRFAKIMNKSRRKTLKSYKMDDVHIIAPAGDRSVYKYENDRGVKIKNYTSRDKKVPYYQMVVKDGDGVVMISFEPDDKFLDAVCVKYQKAVVRRNVE